MLDRGLAAAKGPVALKLELLQPTGSFKVRGAFNRLLAGRPPVEGVVAASGGNFGLAVAYAAGTLGVAATIFVPETSPRAKIEALERLDARVEVVAGYYPDALAASRAHLAANGGLFAHAFDQPEVVAGQGTCAMEISQQVPGVDTVITAVGGGGLIGGIASWFRGTVKVIGAETEGTAQLAAAIAAGHPVPTPVSGIAASALGSGQIGAIGWAAASQWVDQSVVVTDEAVVEAQKALWRECRLIVEPGAATTLAALLTGAYVPEAEERVCLVLSGGNTDPGPVAAV